jgi:hypothetical protein
MSHSLMKNENDEENQLDVYDMSTQNVSSLSVYMYLQIQIHK